MATTEPKLKEDVKSLETKVNVLTWIGLIPDMAGMMAQLEVQQMSNLILNDKVEDGDMEKAIAKVKDMNVVMNDGVGIVLKKLNTKECIECGKCDDLRVIVQDLADGEKPIDEINAVITEKYGNIANSIGAGMPGHQRPEGQRAPGGGIGAILSLLQALGGRRPGRGEVTDEVEMLVKNHRKPDKDTLH